MMPTTIPNIPLRSPTPPSESSGDELNELSLEQELAHLDRPHFLDYTRMCIPYPMNPSNENPPPIPPRHPLTNSLPSVNRRSSIPVKMIRSADNVPSDVMPPPVHARGKKHFLDENPIRPDYDYDRSHHSLDREYTRNEGSNDGNKSQFDGRHHSADRSRQRKAKEPSYTLSRFLENNDGVNYSFNDSAVGLNDVTISCSNPAPDRIRANPSVDVYSILSMIGCNNPVEMSKKFLDLSKSPNTCATLRHTRCIPLLVQMIHFESDELTKRQAREALRNVVNTDDKVGRREAKVLRYIEQIMDYCELLRKSPVNDGTYRVPKTDSDNHPSQAMSSLMKISFDEEHRHAMCQLGALQTIANLVHWDHAVHGTDPTDTKCIELRRYAGMALTNLTFGDGNNKALLCGNRDFMKALVAQINTDADDLLQVTANVLRNLSWRADNDMKTVLNEIGTVSALTRAAMKNRNENTLRAILSALWNLSAHCSKNKAELCLVDGALLFLVEMLTYDAPSRTLSIIENAGGILRNVSSHIAINGDFRRILRQRNCLGILLQQLKSESLTIVSNACGTLWNLSARCPEDQQFLWDNGAVPMLRSLVHSKHKMISNGSKVALKNLINFRPGEMNRSTMDPVARSMGLKELPTLSARRQKALEEELHVDLPNTCEPNEVTRTPPPLINQKPARRFTSLETDQQFVERNFSHLQCRDRAAKNDFWNANQIQPHLRSNSNDIPSTSGTIPKRVTKTVIDESKDNKSDPLSGGKSRGPNAPKKHEVSEGDQITNFSLLYSENPPDMRDAKQHKERTYSVAENDTIKCFDNEETPLLSTATSISDLRPVSKPTNPHHLHQMQRHLKSGRNTTENSGINTPERPVNYCDEGTPAYFSRRDSFSSLAEEAEFAQDSMNSNKPQIPSLNKVQSNISHSRQGSENDGSSSCTVPTTPGECPSKSVKFNECNLETPMMFSRHSSLGSLASNEPALNDDIASVVSEISRMPSGTISPSEIPDSPSQTMPQSPRRRQANESTSLTFAAAEHPCTGAAPTHHLPFEDEVKTFGVENTPALISCATSLSNLSLDDEPKIANDSLIKEMRLIHNFSDEQEDELASNAVASSSSQQISNANPEVHVDCDAGEALSDTDDSIEDGENDSLLLENCINMGIACGNQMKSLDSGLKSPPALPEPNQILPDDRTSSDDENHDNVDDEDLLEQCIQAGINTSTAKKIEVPPNQCESQVQQRMIMVKENPIRMLRKGGNSFIDTNIDELNRFSYEDSPCNHSVMSGLSDLTVGSHTARLLKPNRLPSNQQNPSRLNDSQNNDPVTGQASIQETPKSTSNTTLPNSNAATVRSGDVPNVRQRTDSSSSISSNNSNEEKELLEQCILAGMNASTKGQPTKMVATKEHDFSSDDELNDDDEALLEQCIQAGISGTNVVAPKSKAKPIPSKAPNKFHSKSDSTKENLNDSMSSIDSVGDEDADLLEQCVQAGINVAAHAGRTQAPISKLNQSASKVSAKINNLSSDDDDFNPENEALLEQCIQAGICGVGVSAMNSSTTAQDQTKQSSMINDPRKCSPIKRSQLPTFKSISIPATNHRSRPTNRDHNDQQTLIDPQNKGIDRNIRMRSTLTENRMPIRSKNVSDANSKNAQTTSAVVSSTVGATDVVMNNKNGTEICAPDQYQTVDTEEQIMNSTKESNTAKDDIIDIKVSATPTETGFNQSSLLSTSVLSIKSQNSFMSGEIPPLERSNEFPACLGQDESISDSQHSSSIDMEVSNECLFESLSPSKNGKYKDPNLMLQSVERFTYELVSTAEYLRTANGSQDDDDVTITEAKCFSESKSVSNNTWNEDTNPNAISFPSLSMIAPKIASSMNDDDVTISESNAKSHYEMANSELIEDSTPTNEQKSGGICFEIGGQINGWNFSEGKYNPNSLESYDTTSTMTNSTIIAMEAEKIRTQIMNDQNRSDSIISLDKVRPPSVMDKMNSYSYCESLNGPQSLKNSPARCLPHGFMARRALQNNCNTSTHGSSDSINSSCNLDRVKPPSIMDDLLDSMVSVDSIASECVDSPVEQPIEEPSHYETALSECDDMTMTLRNCADLPFDSTPCGSDFSSAESTPKKGRQSSTPRRKRQLTKERYQTYTIATGESKEAMRSIEIQNGSNASTSSNNATFQMQISNHTLLINDNDSDIISLVSTDDGEMSSIRAFTRNLPYLDDVSYSNDVTYVNDANDITYVNEPHNLTYINDATYVNDVNDYHDFSINTNTFTKHDRPSLQRNAQSQPKASGSSYGSLSTERDSNSNASSKAVSPNHTIMNTPRIVKPAVNGNGPSSIESADNEPKGIRGRKKATYVSPYAMSKLIKTAPAPPKPVTRNTAPKVEPQKTPPPKTETKAKSFIRRSAESFKKIKPAFASKLIRQNSTKKSPSKTAEGSSPLDSQKSNDSTQSTETLIRQSTFIKDEPSEGEIPVIASEPTSPKKSKTLYSKIPFNRTTSLQASRNVTKCKTNIDIPLQKSASSAFARRTIKAASSTSQISSPKTSLSPKSSIDSPSTSKSLFKRWSSTSKTISSPQQGTSKIPAAKPLSREPIGSNATRKISGTLSFRSAASTANSSGKQSKIVTTSRPLSTNGRVTKV